MKKRYCLFPQLLIRCSSCVSARGIVLGCLLLLGHFTFSQSNVKLHQVKLKWKLGDQKIVHTKSSTKVFIKDSLYNNTEAVGNYRIKVIDTVKYYTLLYASEPNAIDIETKSAVTKVDSVVTSFANIIKKIEKETQSFQYKLLVDKKTGLAVKVKNSEEFLKTVEQITATMIAELGEKLQKSSMQIDSAKQKINAYFKLAEPKILETMINQFNYLMQPYSFEFPYNATISQKAMVHDVNAVGGFGGVEMPATLTISSKKSNSILTIQTDTDYDKDFLLTQIKKKYKNMSKLTTSDIFLSEKEEATFTATSGWIISHKSDVVFSTKEVKVVSGTIVSFR
jgi:hypothetical protein